MTLLARWLRFNIVGATGILLQLALVALFAKALRLPTAFATALAVELTLLSNFTLHRRFTWRAPDRERQSERHRSSALQQLLRFHLGNGAVSLTGNVLLTPFLVHRGLPILAANAIAIALCSVANFLLAARWVFRPRSPSRSPLEARCCPPRFTSVHCSARRPAPPA